MFIIKKIIIKTFGKFLGETRIYKGAFKGTYEVYRFLGETYEFKIN